MPTQQQRDVLELDVGAGGARLSPALIERWRGALRTQTDARVVLLTSSATAFCEGLDLDELGSVAAPEDAGVGAFGTLLDALHGDPRPVIALVDGAAKGGGVGLAAAADLVIASDRATFALPEVLIGLVPAVVFPFLTRRMGVTRARWLALGGEPLSAPRALAHGLVDELSDDLPRRLDQVLQRLRRMDARALATVKRLVATHFTAPSAYRADAVGAFVELLGSEATLVRLARLREGLSPWDES